MSNIEELQSMSLEKFAEWLDEYGQFDNSPWMKWFNEKYCNKCEAIKCEVNQQFGANDLFIKQEVECSYCELEKKCRFFTDFNNVPSNIDIIKMWLIEEVEE